MTTMIGFQPLASGSKGNCIYFKSAEKKILIDCGLSGRAVLQRLAQIHVAPEDLDAIFITHEHIDHVQGLKILGCKLNIPVYANSQTARGIVDQIAKTPSFKIFSTGESFQFADMLVHPFSIPHDSSDPVAFTVETQGLKFGFCTDLGHFTRSIEEKLKGCDALYIEANHDVEMLLHAKRPQVYKQRVLGRGGHLSNESCGELLKAVACDRLKQVTLAHLSEECNDEALAVQSIQRSLEGLQQNVQVVVAKQATVGQEVVFHPVEAGKL